MTSFWTGLGEILNSLLSIAPALGNIPNLLAIFVMAILFIWWTGKLISYKKNGEA